MTPIRRIVCPSCEAGLKVAATLPPEKRIRCPKCTSAFRFAEARDWVPAAKAAPVRSLPRRPASRGRGDLEEEERRPAARKSPKKKKKVALNRPLVLGLGIGAAVLVLGVGITLALVRPWETKKAQVVANSTPSNAQPRPPRPRRPPGGGPAPKDPATNAASGNMKTPGGQPPAEAVESLPAPAGKEPDVAAPMQLAAGKKVFESLDCAKCHAIGGSPGGGFKKGRGPSLARVGAEPAHTVEWLSEQIRNPRSHRPGSRMPPFPEDKISGADLRSLAEYLASLK